MQKKLPKAKKQRALTSKSSGLSKAKAAKGKSLKKVAKTAKLQGRVKAELIKAPPKEAMTLKRATKAVKEQVLKPLKKLAEPFRVKRKRDELVEPTLLESESLSVSSAPVSSPVIDVPRPKLERSWFANDPVFLPEEPSVKTVKCVNCSAELTIKQCQVQRCKAWFVSLINQQVCADCLFERGQLTMTELVHKAKEQGSCPHCQKSWEHLEVKVKEKPLEKYGVAKKDQESLPKSTPKKSPRALKTPKTLAPKSVKARMAARKVKSKVAPKVKPKVKTKMKLKMKPKMKIDKTRKVVKK